MLVCSVFGVCDVLIGTTMPSMASNSVLKSSNIAQNSVVCRVRGLCHKINRNTNRIWYIGAVKGKLPYKASAVQSKLYCTSFSSVLFWLK